MIIPDFRHWHLPQLHIQNQRYQHQVRSQALPCNRITVSAQTLSMPTSPKSTAFHLISTNLNTTYASDFQVQRQWIFPTCIILVNTPSHDKTTICKPHKPISVTNKSCNSSLNAYKNSSHGFHIKCVHKNQSGTKNFNFK